MACISVAVAVAVATAAAYARLQHDKGFQTREEEEIVSKERQKRDKSHITEMATVDAGSLGIQDFFLATSIKRTRLRT